MQAGKILNLANDGWTALFWAARNSELPENAADVYIQYSDDVGQTALDVAVKDKVHKILWEVTQECRA